MKDSIRQPIQNVERHVPVLDAIRGLAILLVLVIHVGEGMPAPSNHLWALFSSVAKSSWVGVDLFFVLSGFLITGILYDTRGASNFFRAFYARRFLRIFPLYYGFLFLLLVLTTPLQIEWHGRQWIYLLYLQNTRIMKNVQSAPFSPYLTIGHFWSLAVEEQFYCLWPALVFWVKDRSRLIKIAAVLIVASIALRLVMLSTGKSLWMIYTFTPARADSLMIGSVLALLFHSGLEKQQQLKRIAMFLLPACIVALLSIAVAEGNLSFSSRNVIRFGFTLIALASASLITLSLTSNFCQAAINRSALRWLGKYSYGIYVLHLPVMMLLLQLPLTRQLQGFSLNPLWRLIILLVVVAVAVALAYISFKLYELRFLRMKKFFRYEFPEVGAHEGEVSLALVGASPEPVETT